MEYVEIKISKDIYEKLQKKVEDMGFSSVSELVEYVLQELLEDSNDNEKEATFTKEDEEKIKERLRALGYLD